MSNCSFVAGDQVALTDEAKEYFSRLMMCKVSPFYSDLVDDFLKGAVSQVTVVRAYPGPMNRSFSVTLKEYQTACFSESFFRKVP